MVTPITTRTHVLDAKVRQMGRCEELVALMRDGTDAQKEQAAADLADFALDQPTGKEWIREGNPPTHLNASLPRACPRRSYVPSLATPERRLCTTHAVCAAGGVSLLVDLASGGTIVQKEKAAAALRNLAWANETNEDEIRVCGGIPVLIQLARDGDTEGQLEFAAGALR